MDSFCFLQECLDEDTQNYMRSGLKLDVSSDAYITQADFINKIGQILGVEKIMDVSYTTTILNAFSCYTKPISIAIQKDNKSVEARLINYVRKIVNRIDSKRDKNPKRMRVETHKVENESSGEIQSINSIFQMLYAWIVGSCYLPSEWSTNVIANELYPYFFLSLILKEYPDWLLFKDFPIDLFGLPLEDKEEYIATLPKIWHQKVNDTFVDKHTREAFEKLIFMISFLEVLRKEHALLEESSLIAFQDIQLPINVSSKFMRIKFDSLSEDALYVNCIALIMGVYVKSGRRSERIRELLVQQETGQGSLTSVQPIKFASWQAKKLIEHHSLDPFFAILSSLKYSDPLYWAQKYYDFQEFVEKDPIRLNKQYSGTLYINHFFPYHILSNGDVIKTEGLSSPELAKDGLPTGRFIYQPLVRESICLDLVDRIYLSLSGYDDSMLRALNECDIETFSFVQVDNIDYAVSRNYYKYLSNIGAWRVVKDKFEAELDKRVNAAIADIRHNVKHYIDHFPRQMEGIEKILGNKHSKSTDKILRYVRDTRIKSIIALRVLNYSLSGLETSEFKHLKWNETILRLLEEMPNLNTRIAIEYDKGNVDDDLMFPFRDKAYYFAQMIQNIIKNADDHGFSGYNITNPVIRIVSQLYFNILSLTFMNNGAPLAEGMSKEEYRTRGLSGQSSKSGLGGAQIDRIIRAHGGEICELSSNDEWNFILRINFKLK